MSDAALNKHNGYCCAAPSSQGSFRWPHTSNNEELYLFLFLGCYVSDCAFNGSIPAQSALRGSCWELQTPFFPSQNGLRFAARSSRYQGMKPYDLKGKCHGGLAQNRTYLSSPFAEFM
ncbi:sodium/potassium-transporting ATPase subunit alpha-1 [Platysternon megacephalum]|uniref:Sodium/potassium-transporting ATPase subunit alpha-1 n=1 Tax=Platysternon megacephalum TaxID=55544 RepID=A0A4D9EEA3_9SAUR|nr:sodium/potassium-transporting ATPase subunit alpha-1 [Platysternon megacephalum]